VTGNGCSWWTKVGGATSPSLHSRFVPHVIFTCLYHLKSSWEASGSTPMKRSWKQCSLGWAVSQKELEHTSYLKGGPNVLQRKDNNRKVNMVSVAFITCRHLEKYKSRSNWSRLCIY
jgi:hypothetical protein